MAVQTTTILLSRKWKMLSYEEGQIFLVQSRGGAIELYVGILEPTDSSVGFTVDDTWQSDRAPGQIYGRAKQRDTSVTCVRPVSTLNAVT